MLPGANSRPKSGWWRLTHGESGKPILLVLALGIGLFLALAYLNRNRLAVDPKTFVLERDKPLTYIRLRSSGFDQDRLQVDPELAGQADSLTSANEVPPWAYDQLCNSEFAALCTPW